MTRMISNGQSRMRKKKTTIGMMMNGKRTGKRKTLMKSKNRKKVEEQQENNGNITTREEDCIQRKELRERKRDATNRPSSLKTQKLRLQNSRVSRPTEMRNTTTIEKGKTTSITNGIRMGSHMARVIRRRNMVVTITIMARKIRSMVDAGSRMT